LLLLGILGVAFYFILPYVATSRHAFSNMAQANFWLLGLAVAFEVGAFLAYSFLTRSVFHSLRAELSLWTVLRIVLAGFAASRIFSVGGIGGFVVTYQALAKRGLSRSIAVVAVATQQFFNYIVLWIIFFIAIFYLLTRGQGSVAGLTFAVVCIALILGHLVYLIYLYNHPTRLRRRAHQFALVWNRVRRKKPIELNSIDEWVDNLRAGIRPMTGKRGAVRTNLISAALWWTFDISCLTAVFAAYGPVPHLGSILIAYSVAYTVATFVPTPGGLGTVETILLALLTGFDAKNVVTCVLIYRVINFWLPIPFGAAAYLTIRRGAGDQLVPVEPGAQGESSAARPGPELEPGSTLDPLAQEQRGQGPGTTAEPEQQEKTEPRPQEQTELEPGSAVKPRPHEE
jgi:uncharacterized protein (TIRG00374 family)